MARAAAAHRYNAKRRIEITLQLHSAPCRRRRTEALDLAETWPARNPSAGSIKRGTIQSGTIQSGTIQNGTIQNGTIQNGTILRRVT